MRFNDLETHLLFHPSGVCRTNSLIRYLSYNKNNWQDVKEFCMPFSIERTKKGTTKGRAVIDLPTGNTAFEYGMILVRLGNTRILVCSQNEFEELFSIAI